MYNFDEFNNELERTIVEGYHNELISLYKVFSEAIDIAFDDQESINDAVTRYKTGLTLSKKAYVLAMNILEEQKVKEKQATVYRTPYVTSPF